MPSDETTERAATSGDAYPGPNGTAVRASAEQAQRVCLFVLGMHRSGTSSIAGTLAKLGATPPAHPLGAHEGNSAGHWESQPLVLFHDELLASAGSRWDDWREFNPNWRETPIAKRFRTEAKRLLAEEFGDSPVFVFKDPRNCRLAGFWFDIFAELGIDAKIVVPIRSPLEVAQSHRARDGFPLRKGLLLWLRHVLDAEAVSRDHPRIVLEWDAFLKDWQNAIFSIEQALGPLPANTDLSAVEVDRFLSDDLKRQRVGRDELARNPIVHAWVEETYAAMCELARNPGSNSARAILDQIRSQFNTASALFGGVMADTEAWASDLLQKYEAAVGSAEDAARLAQAQAGLAAKLVDFETTILQDKAENANLQRQIETLRADMLAQNNSAIEQYSSLQAERDTAASEAMRIAAERSHLEKQLDDLKSELFDQQNANGGEAGAERAKASAEIEAIRQTSHGQLQDLKEQHESRIAEYERTLSGLRKDGEMAVSELADLKSALQMTQQTLEAERVERAQALERLHASLSWRLTAKLRRVGALLGR